LDHKPYIISVSEIETEAKNIIDMEITMAMNNFMVTSLVMVFDCIEN